MTAEQTPSKAPESRRRSERRRVLKSGVVAFNNRHSTLPCTVRDLSEHGAKLLLAGTIDAPDTFELTIELDGLEADCQVVARRAGEVRVKFLSAVRKVVARRTQVLQAVVPEKQISLRRKPRLGEGV